MAGGDTARLRGSFTQAKKGNKLAVLVVVVAGLGISGASLAGAVDGRSIPIPMLLSSALPPPTALPLHHTHLPTQPCP